MLFFLTFEKKNNIFPNPNKQNWNYLYFRSSVCLVWTFFFRRTPKKIHLQWIFKQGHFVKSHNASLVLKQFWCMQVFYSSMGSIAWKCKQDTSNITLWPWPLMAYLNPTLSMCWIVDIGKILNQYGSLVTSRTISTCQRFIEPIINFQNLKFPSFFFLYKIQSWFYVNFNWLSFFLYCWMFILFYFFVFFSMKRICA